MNYIDEVAQIMSVRARGAVPVAMIHTYGCQQNVADSEKIKGQLEQMGFFFYRRCGRGRFDPFNTCAIREHAEDRVFGNVGALKNIKRRHPSLLVALCGCMMEQPHVAERIQKSFPFVNLVFGTHAIHRLPELLHDTLVNGKRVFDRQPEDESKIVEGVPVRRDGTVKAWVTIMYGCNNFCSYCVVPYVRGRERSREPEAILEEFKGLVQAGYKDITLLGQNVNSYGKSLANPVSFAELLHQLDQVPGDYRIRFMTSHPKDATKELFNVMAQGKHISHHLHLPCQSGNDRVLKEMNRHYDRERYLSLIRYAKQQMPDLSITSDIIVGFPGETYEEFQDTVSLIQEVGFTSLFTFYFFAAQRDQGRKDGRPGSGTGEIAMVPGALRRSGTSGGGTLCFYGRADRTGSGGRAQCENRTAFWAYRRQCDCGLSGAGQRCGDLCPSGNHAGPQLDFKRRTGPATH